MPTNIYRYGSRHRICSSTIHISPSPFQSPQIPRSSASSFKTRISYLKYLAKIFCSIPQPNLPFCPSAAFAKPAMQASIYDTGFDMLLLVIVILVGFIGAGAIHSLVRRAQRRRYEERRDAANRQDEEAGRYVLCSLSLPLRDCQYE